MTYNFWLERRLDFPIFNLLPIDSPEKLVAPDILLALVAATQAFSGVFSQKLECLVKIFVR